MQRISKVVAFVLFIAAMNMQAQRPKKELILKTRPLSEWQVFHIKSKLATMKGLCFCGYQPLSRCLMLQYDPTVYTKPDGIVRTIKNTETIGFVKIVQGMTIYQVLDGEMDSSHETACDPAEH